MDEISQTAKKIEIIIVFFLFVNISWALVQRY